MSTKAKITKKKTSSKTAANDSAGTSDPTLADIAAGYLADLEGRGSGDSTISGYRAELKAAARALGEDTAVSAITVADVQSYFESDVVMKTRAGEPRSTRTIDRSRRVLRLALWWAEEHGLVSKAPLPEHDDPRERESVDATTAPSTNGAAA